MSSISANKIKWKICQEKKKEGVKEKKKLSISHLDDKYEIVEGENVIFLCVEADRFSG